MVQRKVKVLELPFNMAKECSFFIIVSFWLDTVLMDEYLLVLLWQKGSKKVELSL